MADTNHFRTILDGFIDGSAYKKPVLPTAMQAVKGIRLWQPPGVTDRAGARHAQGRPCQAGVAHLEPHPMAMIRMGRC